MNVQICYVQVRLMSCICSLPKEEARKDVSVAAVKETYSAEVSTINSDFKLMAEIIPAFFSFFFLSVRTDSHL